MLKCGLNGCHWCGCRAPLWNFCFRVTHLFWYPFSVFINCFDIQFRCFKNSLALIYGCINNIKQTNMADRCLVFGVYTWESLSGKRFTLNMLNPCVFNKIITYTMLSWKQYNIKDGFILFPLYLFSHTLCSEMNMTWRCSMNPTRQSSSIWEGGRSASW